LNLFLYSSLKKTWKVYWSEQSFTGLGLDERCSLWGLLVILMLYRQTYRDKSHLQTSHITSYILLSVIYCITDAF